MTIQYEKSNWKYRLEYSIRLNLATKFPSDDIEPIAIHDRFGDGLILELTRGDLVLHRGYGWDGPSGPAIDTESTMEASAFHDAFYSLIKLGHLDVDPWKARADRIYHDLILENGLIRPSLQDSWNDRISIDIWNALVRARAFWHWKAVSWFGSRYCRKED